MKYKSRAIALTYIKHGESSIISRIFTEEKGLQSFIVKGVRSKKTKKKISYFEPLRLLNINAKFNEKNSLQYLEDVSIIEGFGLTKNKMHKNFIAFFIAEIGSKVLQENDPNKMLFEFIWETSASLYRAKNISSNFALKYLLNLSRFLGFYPSKTEITKPFFDLENGCFSEEKAVSKIIIGKQRSVYLKALINNQPITIPKNEKSKLLKDLLCYYKLHHYNLDGITSHVIIESLN